MKKIIGVFLCYLACMSIKASDQGVVSFDNRAYNSDGNSKTRDYNFSISSRIEGRVDTLRPIFAGSLQYGFVGKADAQDSNRSQAFIEQLYWMLESDYWQFKLGYQVFNWSATEAFHPTDTINSRNLDADIDRIEKMGEPTVSLSFFPVEEFGVTLLYFPMYIEPYIPSGNNRLTIFNPDYPLGKPLWVEGFNEFSSDDYGDQFGAVVDITLLGDWKFFYLNHMDRHNPLINVNPLTTELRPVYLPVQRYGFSFQTDLDAHLLKLEFVDNSFRKNNGTYLLQSLNQDDFSILAFGWDYGFGHDGGGDSTFILEHQRMMGVDKSTRQALSYFQNDLLLGYRLAFNDVMGKELFFSIIYDLEKENGDEFIYTIRYAQRLSDVWSTTFDLRVIDAAPVDPNNPLGVEFFDEDQQFTFKLKRYF